MPAPIITLTTDLGRKDFYIPSVKGYFLRELPAANIVDITHEVRPFHIAEASFIIRGCFADFPAGTVHIIGVDADHSTENRFLLAKAAGHYFLCPDNGLLSLVLDDTAVEEVVALPYEKAHLIFPLKNILAPAAVALLKGAALATLGQPYPQYQRKAHLQPVMEETIMRGGVIYIDNMGNAITNIHRDHFDRYPSEQYVIYIRRNEYFERIHTYYDEVPEGEKLCLFGSTGLLEISINKGNAAGLLGLKPGHTILIEFL